MKHSPLEANEQLADEGVSSPDRRLPFRKAAALSRPSAMLGLESDIQSFADRPRAQQFHAHSKPALALLRRRTTAEA